MEQIIKYGFKCINFNVERNSTLKKGYKLAESGHAFGIVEKVDPKEGVSRITGQCTPQTNVNRVPYSVCIEVCKYLHYSKLDLNGFTTNIVDI